MSFLDAACRYLPTKVTWGGPAAASWRYDWWVGCTDRLLRLYVYNAYVHILHVAVGCSEVLLLVTS